MKKLLWMACICMLAMVYVGCDSKTETQKVAEKYMEFSKNEDVDAMFDMMYFKDDSRKETFKAMVKEKISKKSENYKKVKEYSFKEETVDKEKGSAVVKFNVIYENSTDSASQDVKLKNIDGKWMVDSGK